jgi:hypothetical protein
MITETITWIMILVILLALLLVVVVVNKWLLVKVHHSERSECLKKSCQSTSFRICSDCL